MTQTTIPKLTLFNKIRSKSNYAYHDQVLSTKPVIIQSQRDRHLIYNHHYVPHIRTLESLHFQQQYLNNKKIAELEYLNTYYDELNKNLLRSNSNTSRYNHNNYVLPPQKQVNNKPIKYPNDENKKPVKPIVPPIKPTIKDPIKQDNPKPTPQIIKPPSSPINHIQNNKSPQIKKSFVQHDVQTDQVINNRSSYIIQKPTQKLDHKTFRKIIGNLNQRINNVNLDMNTQDVIVDIGDLIETKQRYIQQSQSLLKTLNLLAEQKWTVTSNNNKNQNLVWPQL